MNQSSASSLLEVEDLVVRYQNTRPGLFSKEEGFLAVDGVSFSVEKGTTVGLVGESGSGKSTIAKALVRLVAIERGRIAYAGSVLSGLPERQFRPFRRRIQTIFQDPYASLDPRQTVESIIAEPWVTHQPATRRNQARERVVSLLEKVGLPADSLNRFPHQFSGGQRQRIGIARALSCQPEFIICDECVSALDVSVQAQIVNLLKDLQDEYGLTYLFIAHDLAVVEHMSHKILVMRYGKIVEQGDSKSIYLNPKHEYTQKLLNAVPKLAGIRTS